MVAAAPAMATMGLTTDSPTALVSPLTTVLANETAMSQRFTKKLPTLATTELPVGALSFRFSNTVSSTSCMKLVTVEHGVANSPIVARAVPRAGPWPSLVFTGAVLLAAGGAPRAVMASALNKGRAMAGKTSEGASVHNWL